MESAQLKVISVQSSTIEKELIPGGSTSGIAMRGELTSPQTHPPYLDLGEGAMQWKIVA